MVLIWGCSGLACSRAGEELARTYWPWDHDTSDPEQWCLSEAALCFAVTLVRSTTLSTQADVELRILLSQPPYAEDRGIHPHNQCNLWFWSAVGGERIWRCTMCKHFKVELLFPRASEQVPACSVCYRLEFLQFVVSPNLQQDTGSWFLFCFHSDSWHGTLTPFELAISFLYLPFSNQWCSLPL